MRNSIIFLFIQLFLIDLFSQDNNSIKEKTEKPAPSWISERPLRSNYYIGIGMSDKVRSNDYLQEAKKNALYDLASEIEVKISSNSILTTYSSDKDYNQNFNSQIRLNNSLNIEDFRMVGNYDNGKEYWVYYELNKSEYEKSKIRKKNNAVSRASNLISYSFTDELNNDFTSSLKKRIQAFSTLGPYLNEEIEFDESISGRIKNVYELTQLIQSQLQNISILSPEKIALLKPFKNISEKKITYRMLSKNKVQIKNFPFYLENEDGLIFLDENGITDFSGDLRLNVTGVETDFRSTSITVTPDLENLIRTDSVPKSAISLLKSFVQIPHLKIDVITEPINVNIKTSELNFSQKLSYQIINDFARTKFGGGEFRLTDDVNLSDFIIEINSNTSKDISSDILYKNYRLYLARLNISIIIKNKSGESIYTGNLSDIYGYSGNIEEAGLNAYNNEDLKNKLLEIFFFMKRAMIKN